MTRSSCLAMAILCVWSLPSGAQTVPAPIYTDPVPDAKNPASMAVLHIPSHGVSINGVLYSPPGAGAHPTFVFCHGLPGNEKNLDLAQAVRRAGWNSVTFNYRGSWGSPGKFRFAQNIEDAQSVLKFLREPVNAAKYHIDTHHLVLAGHSMGGWVTAHSAAQDPDLAGAVLISMGDMGRFAGIPEEKRVAMMADNMESLAGVTARSMAAEVDSHAKDFPVTTASTVDGLLHVPLLVLTADDGLAVHSDDLVTAIKSKGGTHVSATHVATDHSWDDHRIALEALVIQWLAALP